MIIFPLLLILFIFCLFFIDVLATETKSEDLAIREYVFLIDTSASMSEKIEDPSGHVHLYEKLQEEVKIFISTYEEKSGEETRFYFYTFDEGIAKQADNKVKVFNISSSDTNYTEKIGKYVDSLEFSGDYTHICSSLETVLAKHEATDHPVIIRLYTDGEENQQDKVTREVLWPPPDEFVEKIKSLREGGKWSDNEYLQIYTLNLVWSEKTKNGKTVEEELEEVPNIDIYRRLPYSILVEPKDLNFADLYDTGEGEATLTFNIIGTNWDEFTKKYPDLTVNITPQGFTSDTNELLPIEFIEYFTPFKLSSIKDRKYNLTFIVKKDKMIKNEKYGNFGGYLSLSVSFEEVKEDIGVSIDKNIKVSFSFNKPEKPEEYHILIKPTELDFGDLYDIGEGVEKLYFSISIDTGKKINWDEFKAEYPYLIINATPQEFIPEIPTPTVVVSALTDGKYNLTFKIKKDEMIKNEKFGEFSGELVFSIEENNISIKSTIPVKFNVYQPEVPEVEVTLSPLGEGKIPIDFGTIKEEKQYKQKIMLDFNQQAKGKELKVSLDISPDNPSELVIGKNLWINGQEKKSIDVISATKEIELVLEVTPSELKYGRYAGKIYFTGDELEIKGIIELKTDYANPNQKYYEWTFKTPMPLWMIVLIGVICLIVLLSVIYLILTIIKGGSIALPSLKSSKAVIPDETYLYIRDYDTGKREQINISGKKEVIIGKDGQYLNDIEERMILSVIREDGKNLVRLTVESGKVTLIKAGSMKEEIVIDQTIFNRDVIKFGNYQIRVSSFYLERDIN